jgi:hypothetical protein
MDLHKVVDVDDAINWIKSYRALNEPELENLVFIQNGERVEVDEEAIAKFSRLGLNNADFIRWYFIGDEFFTSILVKLKKSDPKDT